MNKTNKNSKKTSVNLAPMLILVLVGAVCGFSASFFLGNVDVFGEDKLLLNLALKLALMICAYCIQLVIHESGHLVAGLISGYGFSSFRIGSLMIVKSEGRLRLKKHSVAGTGGQCLMTPPPMKDGRYPVIFYNLGGALLNLVTVPLFAGLAFALRDILLLYIFCVMMALMGFVNAGINGIPMKLGTINNDGSNARELAGNSEAMLVFYNQFKILEEISDGTRLRDMPDEWFFVPSDEGMKNSITASSAVFFENRLIDCGRLGEANELIDKLLSMDSALIGLHKNLLLADKITIELILGGDLERIEEMYRGKEFTVFAKQMASSISVVRMQYAYARLSLHDEKLAEKHLEAFEKCAKTHPYAPDIETERELLAMIDEKARSMQ